VPVNANIVPSSRDCHPDDGGDTFLRNVGSYKSHKASHPRSWHSSNGTKFSATQNYLWVLLCSEDLEVWTVVWRAVELQATGQVRAGVMSL
jgi:hypothetical protein